MSSLAGRDRAGGIGPSCIRDVAQQGTGSRAGIPASLQLGIGVHDPRIRVDPDAVPWRAVGKIQVASLNFRTGCTATLVAQSTVVTAAHCLFNRRTRRYFPPESLHFLIGYRGSGYAGHAVGISMKVGNGYDPFRPKETIGSDWALVFLDKRLGSADRTLPILDDLPEDGASVMLGGYQQDHPFWLIFLVIIGERRLNCWAPFYYLYDIIIPKNYFKYPSR